MEDATGAHPTLEQLAAFDRGQLPPEERAAVERHVAGCDACCARLESVPDDALVGLLREATGSRPRPATERAREIQGPVPTPPRGSAPGPTEVPPETANHPRYLGPGPADA